MSNLIEFRNKLEQLKGRRDRIEQEAQAAETKANDLELDLKFIEQARTVLQTTAEITQQELTYHISEVVTLALASVFDDPYELSVQFVPKRGRTEAVLAFTRNGQSIHPLDGSGVGAIDIAAFALRVALWTLRSPRSINTLILDEPFKHLKGEEANRRAIQMVKEISTRLGLQIIMVSDERAAREDIVTGADKVFETSLKKGVTIMREIGC